MSSFPEPSPRKTLPQRSTRFKFSESLAKTDERDSDNLREARFRNGDLITFFLEGDTKAPTPAPVSGASLSICVSSSFSSSGGGGKTSCTAGGGPDGAPGGIRASSSAIRTSSSLISFCKVALRSTAFSSNSGCFMSLVSSPDAAASTRPTGNGWFNGGKFCVAPSRRTGFEF